MNTSLGVTLTAPHCFLLLLPFWNFSVCLPLHPLPDWEGTRVNPEFRPQFYYGDPGQSNFLKNSFILHILIEYT